MLGRRGDLDGAGGSAAGRRNIHGSAGARPRPALPCLLRQPLHGPLHPPLRHQPREEEMAIGTQQQLPASSPLLAGSRRGDGVLGTDAAQHEEDVAGHRLHHVQPRPDLHLHRSRLPRVREGQPQVSVHEGKDRRDGALPGRCCHHERPTDCRRHGAKK